MRREGGQVGNPSSQPGKERRGKEGRGGDEKDGRRRCMDQEEKEGATTTKQICPLPLPFLSAKRIPGEMGGGEEKSIITISSRMSLFSVHVAKEGRHVCREGENMKGGS